MRQKLAGAAVRPLADPARGAAPARAAATGPRPLRRDRLRRPGPVHHDGRPARRAAAGPRLLQLPRDQRADLRPSRGPRPRRLVLQPRRGQPGGRLPGPEPVPPSLLLRADVPRAGGRGAARRSRADPLRGRPPPAGAPSRLLPHPRHSDRPGPTRPSPVRSNTSSSSATSSMPWRTTDSTGARSTITPTPCNRPMSSRLTSRSSRPPASAGPTPPRSDTSPGASTSRSTPSSHAA